MNIWSVPQHCIEEDSKKILRAGPWATKDWASVQDVCKPTDLVLVGTVISPSRDCPPSVTHALRIVTSPTEEETCSPHKRALKIQVTQAGYIESLEQKMKELELEMALRELDQDASHLLSVVYDKITQLVNGQLHTTSTWAEIMKMFSQDDKDGKPMHQSLVNAVIDAACICGFKSEQWDRVYSFKRYRNSFLHKKITPEFLGGVRARMHALYHEDEELLQAFDVVFHNVTIPKKGPSAFSRRQ
eukprot:TRINITY_DN29071_c0_g1_i1.p1 TRINITY_DN29071_c0_g1~~TRINITY_DN29071_c0_g1_i1.p1  ORF type:complete len:244 (-),score=12.95 TRINITY_DN29071_c0_g1_i1:11-742(-)